MNVWSSGKWPADYCRMLGITIYLSNNITSFRVYPRSFEADYESKIEWILKTKIPIAYKFVYPIIWIARFSLRVLAVSCIYMYAFSVNKLSPLIGRVKNWIEDSIYKVDPEEVAKVVAELDELVPATINGVPFHGKCFESEPTHRPLTQFRAFRTSELQTDKYLKEADGKLKVRVGKTRWKILKQKDPSALIGLSSTHIFLLTFLVG